MKLKKRLILLPIFLSFLLFSLGCGNTIKESITEKVIEKVTDGQVDVNTKEGEVSFGADEGSLKVGENLEWPKNKFDSLPEPDANIMSITELEEGESTSVILQFNKEDGAPDYIERLEALGYIQQALTKTGTTTIYSAANKDNSLVIFSHDTEENSGSITYSRDNDTAKDFFENKMNKEDEAEEIEINMDESMDWPKGSMDNIPPIKAQITSVSEDSNSVSVGFKGISQDDMADYIDEIKTLGFDLEVMEMIMVDFLNYSASNEKEQTITVNWTSNEGNINYNRNN